jgi:hypothetical protein
METTYPAYRPVSYSWRITLDSDTGPYLITTNGANLLEVIERVTDTERAPIRAVVKVERLNK